MSQVEEPNYTVQRSDGAIELRAYPAMTVASTNVSGSRGAAVNQGFRILADFIFGRNDGAKKIAMTAPVMQERETKATRDPADAKGKVDNKDEWTVRFIMPRALAKDSLPKPKDRRVTLAAMPPATFAVIRFSGRWRDALLRKKTSELEAYIARNTLVATGEPIYAFYNPPWTLPFFRRNEVMIEVRARGG